MSTVKHMNIYERTSKLFAYNKIYHTEFKLNFNLLKQSTLFNHIIMLHIVQVNNFRPPLLRNQ